MAGDGQEVRTYDVELTTLLGKRSGSLGVRLSGECFSGVLRLMKQENPVQGQLSPDGQCRLTGSIRTRMGAYPFEGEGHLLPECLEMILRYLKMLCVHIDPNSSKHVVSILIRLT